MTEQPGSRTLSGTPTSAVAPESIGPAPEESPLGHAAALAHDSFHGRPASWVAVAITVIGFIIGGLAFSSPRRPGGWSTPAAASRCWASSWPLARMSEDWY